MTRRRLAIAALLAYPVGVAIGYALNYIHQRSIL